MRATRACGTRVRVATYNMLSSHLAEPGWFTACNPRDLAIGTRRERLLQRIGVETDRRSVLCLQEVSSTWYEALVPFLQERDYTLLARLYGTPFNGTMGVAIALPNDRFKLSQYHQCHLARTFPKLPSTERRDGGGSRGKGRDAPAAPGGASAEGGGVGGTPEGAGASDVASGADSRPSSAGPSAGLLASPLQWLRRVLGAPPPGRVPRADDATEESSGSGSGEAEAEEEVVESPTETASAAAATPPLPPLGNAASSAEGSRNIPEAWRLAARAKNWMQFALLECRGTGRQLGVANYHMPCTHWCKAAMSLHAWRAAHQAHTWATDAGGVPYLLASDLNAMPADGAYALLTTGALDASHAHAPPPHPLDPGLDLLHTPQPLASAYAAAHGAEPAFTNVATTRDMDAATAPFVETLDYVLVSPGMTVADADPLPGRDTLTVDSFPTADEPSDHLMLCADLDVGVPPAA